MTPKMLDVVKEEGSTPRLSNHQQAIEQCKDESPEKVNNIDQGFQFRQYNLKEQGK